MSDLRVEEPRVLKSGGGGGRSRELEQVVTVAGAVAGQHISELEEVTEDLLAAVSDTTDQASKACPTRGGGSNNASNTLYHC